MLLSVIWKVILHWIRFLKFMITVYGRNWKEVMLSQQRYDHGIPQITLQFGMLKCSLMHSGVCECTSLADADLRAGPYASYCRTADVASKCFQGRGLSSVLKINLVFACQVLKILRLACT